jgi:hypothetical protein
MTGDVDIVESLHADAWQAYRQGFPEIAAALFRKIVQHYPRSLQAADATYYLSHGYRFPVDRAEGHYADLRARRPILRVVSSR